MKKLWSLLTIILLALCLLGCRDKKDNDEDEENLEDEVFTVTFVDMNDNKIYSEKVKYGKKVKQPEYLTYKGYDITGWYRGKNLWNFEKDKVTKNIKLKMSGTPHEYTIEYNLPQDATLNNPIYSFIRVEDIPVVSEQLPTVTYQNEYFQGWFLEPDFINEVSFTNDLPPRDIILFPKFVGDGCDHSFYDGKCKYCGILFEDAEPYDPFPEGMSCREMPELERCGYVDGWEWNFNISDFDGKGMEIIILVGGSEEFDPYHTNYTGERKADKQKQLIQIEQAYNIDLVIKNYPAEAAAWGLDRVQWINDNAAAGTLVQEGHILQICNSWVPTLKEGNSIAELENTFKKAGIFTDLNYEQSKERNQQYSVGSKVYGYSSSDIHADNFLYYNRQLVEEFGLEDPATLWNQGRWDWSDFYSYITAAQAAFDAKSEEKIYAFGGFINDIAVNMLSARGHKLIDNESGTVLFTNPNTIQLYTDLREIYAAEMWAKDLNDVSQSFVKGLQLFAHGQLWFLSSEMRFKDQAYFDIGVVPYPTADGAARPNGEIVPGYLVPLVSDMGFAFPNVSNGQNGLTTAVLVNIMDDFSRGLAPEFDIIDMTKRDIYIANLYKMISGEDDLVDETITAIMSIEDNIKYYGYIDYMDIVSTTVGGGTHWNLEGFATWGMSLVTNEDVNPSEILQSKKDIYRKALAEILYA